MINKYDMFQLKDGRTIKVVDFFKDLFSDELFVVVEENKKIYIAKMQEILANRITNSKILKRTTEEKITLYSTYFRGNDKMVATSFKSNNGKRVYYVLCHLRKKGECPKIKKPNFHCSACKTQKFQPLDKQTVYNHLRGSTHKNQEAFYGIYPITERNTVYFLAFDFDKQDWKKEVTNLVHIMEKFKMKPLLELSQSGNGCHVWLFFEEEISAKRARLLGQLLLRYCMLQKPEITFDSFDRMFPSQDQLSARGFGNLIALPLQGGRVNQGCSRFINKEFQIIEDIWRTLEETPKLSVLEIDKVITQIENEIPINYYLSNREKETTLFTDTDESEMYLEKFNGLISEMLCIKKSDVSNQALVKLKFLSSFHNPAFYAAERKRLSTFHIPRIVSLAEFDDNNIYLPRGLEEDIQKMFPNLVIERKNSKGRSIDVHFEGHLYPEQEEAYNKLISKNMGILSAGTGFGKTVIAAKVIAEKKVSTLILVHNKNLAVQWKNQLEKFLIIDDEPFTELTKSGRKRKKDKIGKLHSGQELRSGLIDVALFQSLVKYPNVEELFKQYGMVIVDEAHHVAAKTFEDVIKKVNSQYLYGLTATPKREDQLQNIIFMRLGKIVHKVDKIIPYHIKQNLLLRFTSLGEQIADIEEKTIHENYEAMIESKERNYQIVNDVVENMLEKRHIIILSRYVKHLEVLKELISEKNLNSPVYILNSKMKNKELKLELDKLKKEGQSFVLLTTGAYAGEGFDMPALDTLMLVMPISGRSSLQQYLGRLLRNLEEKNELKVYDYVDYAIPMMYRMYQKRLGTYKKLGYQLKEDSKTKLSQSNLFTENYYDILVKDLIVAKSGIIVIPFLSRELFGKLATVKEASHLTLFFPSKTKSISNLENKYISEIELLSKLGFHIRYKNKIFQHYAILDDKIVWMLPNNIKDGIALRIFSVSIANKLNRLILD